ncbi:unnamed protein product [Medioppia subpectinata]|uniref:Peptidase S1 domain-containing protein n=1 Tax=Medioppia subpectinata TaxID=1979941 RepID=A0A7R9KFG6_9ACAR|nr:unnamed protein product [Medioppia subpectinata]CAG2102228.1 unnamed protein product [Medioppia subpectinata]
MANVTLGAQDLTEISNIVQSNQNNNEPRTKQFDGTQSQAVDWMESFDYFGTSIGWNDDKRKSKLGTFMIGAARDWFNITVHGSNLTWDQANAKLAEQSLKQAQDPSTTMDGQLMQLTQSVNLMNSEQQSGSDANSNGQNNSQRNFSFNGQRNYHRDNWNYTSNRNYQDYREPNNGQRNNMAAMVQSDETEDNEQEVIKFVTVPTLRLFEIGRLSWAQIDGYSDPDDVLNTLIDYGCARRTEQLTASRRWSNPLCPSMRSSYDQLVFLRHSLELVQWLTTSHTYSSRYETRMSYKRVDLELKAIQSYSNITTAGCGVGRKGNLMDNTCFTYHTSSDTMFAGIQNGRVVQTGETPWTVLITFRKNGSCGANCKVNDIRVYPGLINQSISSHAYYTCGKYFVNPTYEQKGWAGYDLALIRLNTGIPLDGTSGLTGINAICLPEENVTNLNEEYALLNGFGADNENGTGSGIQRMGWTKIMKGYADDSMGQNCILKYKRIPFPSGTAPCTGDSGSPIIQYVNGVAVLIGIHVRVDGVMGTACVDLDPNAKGDGPRVSYHMQWIVNTIYDNNH